MKSRKQLLVFITAALRDWREPIKRHIAIPALVFTIAVASPSAAVAGPITYFIEPVTLSDGHTVDGHITTIGTLGTLQASDIVDYRVTVSGLFPHTFSPLRPSADVDGTLTATPSVLEVTPDSPSATNHN